ncbi:hypothetical protein J7J37_01700 [bacterium]|nr:hypothetical protein [bacterium]
MKEKVIYIKKQEDLASVVEKIILSLSDELILVIPKNSNLAERRLNFKILKREADFSKKKIYLDTEDEKVKRFAQEEDIPLVDDYSQFFGSEEIGAKGKKMADIFIRKGKRKTRKRSRGGPKKDFPSTEEKTLEKEESFKNEEKEQSLNEIEELPKAKEGMDFWQRLMEKNRREKEIENGGALEEKKLSQIFSKEKKSKKKIAFFLSVPAFFILFYFFLFILPKAEITLNSQQDKKEINVSATIDLEAKRVDLENNLLPGKLLVFQREVDKKFPASGSKQIEERAHGIIRIFNAYSSSPQVLIGHPTDKKYQTRFLSSDGKIFRLHKRIVIPGAKIVGGKIVPSHIDVEVFADEPGEEYNIGPSKFVIAAWCEKNSPKCKGFYAQSFQPMKGGAKKEVKVVSQKDIDKAKDLVRKNIEFILEREFKEKIPEDYFSLENGWQIEEEFLDSEVKAGEIKNEFNLKGKFVLKGIIIPKDEFLNFAKGIFSQKEGSEKWRVVEVEGRVNNLSFEKEKEGEEETVKADLTIEISLKRKIDENEIKKEILGKSVAEAREILSKKEGINSAEISLRPFWLRKIPKKREKVEIIIR